MTTSVEAPGWGDPGSIRHAEIICHVPAVDLRHHDRWDVYPLSTAELVERGETVTAELEAAVERSRAARADIEKPEYCPNPDCVRLDHPMWEEHEGFEGSRWFTGEVRRG